MKSLPWKCLPVQARFLRDEVIAVEMPACAGDPHADREENGSKGHKQILGFYEAFKKYLIGTITEKQFADLYAQTITYGLFAARTRAGSEFNRRLAFDYIPHTIGILRDVFRFISLEEPPARRIPVYIFGRATQIITNYCRRYC